MTEDVIPEEDKVFIGEIVFNFAVKGRNQMEARSKILQLPIDQLMKKVIYKKVDLVEAYPLIPDESIEEPKQEEANST